MSHAQPRVLEFRFLSVPLIVSQVPGNRPQQAHCRGKANCLPETSTLILRPSRTQNPRQKSIIKPNKARTHLASRIASLLRWLKWRARQRKAIWMSSGISASAGDSWLIQAWIPKKRTSGRRPSSTLIIKSALNQARTKKPLSKRGRIRTPDFRRDIRSALC